jgi:hypothetical protein
MQGSGTGGAPEMGPALVRLTHKSDPGTRIGCPNPRPGLRLRSPKGRWIPVACGRRTCPGCSRRSARVFAEMVWLDTLAAPPTGVLCLTTVDPADARDSGRFRENVRQVVKALRRRWPDAEYLAWVEFTTGQGRRSGGHRRIHWHGFLKGIPSDSMPEAEALARRVWQLRTGAHVVQAEPIRTMRAAIHYLALHHLKPGQAPPEWWQGRRIRPSRGYWSRSSGELRAEARFNLAERVRLMVATAELGDEASALDVEARLSELRAEAEGAWEVVRVREAPRGGVVTPIGLLSDTTRPTRSTDAPPHDPPDSAAPTDPASPAGEASAPHPADPAARPVAARAPDEPPVRSDVPEGMRPVPRVTRADFGACTLDPALQVAVLADLELADPILDAIAPPLPDGAPVEFWHRGTRYLRLPLRCVTKSTGEVRWEASVCAMAGPPPDPTHVVIAYDDTAPLVIPDDWLG